MLKVPALAGEGTSPIFNRYVLQQGGDPLLSRLMYEFKFNCKAVPFDVTIGSLGIVAGDDETINVTTKVPSRTDFNNGIVPNIPAIVKNHPHCFIDEVIAIQSDQSYTVDRVDIDGSPIICTVKDYDKNTTSFTIVTPDGNTLQYDTDQFITLLRDYYSDLNGFCRDINKYFRQLVSKYESLVEQLDTNQVLDKPNAIILRMIKIKQQLYRLLDFMYSAINEEDDTTFESIFSDTYDRLLNLQLLLAAKERIHISNTSLHKVNKPLFQSEDIVQVKQWPNNDKTLEPSWEKGTIRSHIEQVDVDGYGPRRVYIVKFDNGDIQTDIEDYQLILDEEYLLSKRIKESDWKGVKQIVNEESTDPWAREVGWYVATCTHIEHGVKHDDEQHFVYLSDALLAYDVHTVFVGEVREPENDLNHPDLLKSYESSECNYRLLFCK